VETEAFTEALVSHALTLGVFDRVNTVEPKSSPGNGLTASVFFVTLKPDPQRSGLASTSVWLTMNLRIYLPMLTEPQDMIDERILRATDLLLATYSNDFTLDGLIREVDLLGQSGTGLSLQSGYLDIDKTKMRVVDITIPLGVNDAYSQAA
jgi:hypothetical protein